jgi:hypothetical protein
MKNEHLYLFKNSTCLSARFHNPLQKLYLLIKDNNRQELKNRRDFTRWIEKIIKDFKKHKQNRASNKSPLKSIPCATTLSSLRNLLKKCLNPSYIKAAVRLRRTKLSFLNSSIMLSSNKSYSMPKQCQKHLS